MLIELQLYQTSKLTSHSVCHSFHYSPKSLLQTTHYISKRTRPW